MAARRTSRPLAWLLIPVAAGALFAQYALDNNLEVGGGRVNPASGYNMPMGRDPYRINTRTGTFQYNENAAFFSRMPYTAAEQRQLMRSGVMDANSTYARPFQNTGPGTLYTYNRRSGTYRYNDRYAFTQRSYSPSYQSATPNWASPEPLEPGDATPTYRPAPRGRDYYNRSATMPVAPASMSEGYRQERASGATPAIAPGAANSYANLTPQVYRPPFVDLPSNVD